MLFIEIFYLQLRIISKLSLLLLSSFYTHLFFPLFTFSIHSYFYFYRYCFSARHYPSVWTFILIELLHLYTVIVGSMYLLYCYCPGVFPFALLFSLHYSDCIVIAFPMFLLYRYFPCNVLPLPLFSLQGSSFSVIFLGMLSLCLYFHLPLWSLQCSFSTTIRSNVTLVSFLLAVFIPDFFWIVIN